ncbi:ABC transporter permease subunit [Leucobacter sp. gxy201]|uniref:carbohydrate ABC transporter permease n=1 Tax=Leucobacter sp. gxy201 TaxID=2957200 RepID=UPI003DA1109A
MSTTQVKAKPRNPKSAEGRSSHGASQKLFWSFTAPAIVLVVLFTIWPALTSIPLMFQRWPGYGNAQWIGFDNFTRLFTDPDALWALLRTFALTVLAAGGTVILGTAFAIAFHRKIPLSNTLKFIIFLPVILPPTMYALAWKNALDPELGWVNPLLQQINPAWSPHWLSDPNLVLWVVTFIATIQYVGIPMILMVSAMNDIPESINEAATLDGVNAWQRIWKVTLPMTKDVLVVVIGLQIIGNFKQLDTVYALTQGGPSKASDILSTFIYREGFTLGDFGYASVAGFVGTIIIVAASMAYTLFFRPSKISNQ